MEIDVTSRTHPNIYQNLGIPELWRFQRGKLKIYVLENGEYMESEFSLHFPNLPLTNAIPEYLERSPFLGWNKTMKTFRAGVQEQISAKSSRLGRTIVKPNKV